MTVRETIYAALFAQLQTMAPVIIGTTQNPEYSRRFKHWSQVPIGNMPACFMQQYEETADEQQAMGLKRWHSLVNVWWYFNAENYNALPDQTYNAILDSMEAALRPIPPLGKQTLGGLVDNTWIDGKVLYSDGALDHKAVILAQVHLVWNGF